MFELRAAAPGLIRPNEPSNGAGRHFKGGSERHRSVALLLRRGEERSVYRDEYMFIADGSGGRETDRDEPLSSANSAQPAAITEARLVSALAAGVALAGPTRERRPRLGEPPLSSLRALCKQDANMVSSFVSSWVLAKRPLGNDGLARGFDRTFRE